MTKCTFIKNKHKYYLDEVLVPSVTTLLQQQDFMDFSSVNQSLLERSQDFGTAIHEACELYDKKTLEESSLDPGLKPYMESWKKFIKDYGAEFLEIEKIVYSTRWRAAGTLDRVATLKKYPGYTLIDIKSSTAVLPCTALQTAGYKIFWEEMTGLKIARRWIVQLLPNKYLVHKFTEPTDESVFLSALACYRWKRRNKIL